jgi:hypothetical protein
MNIEGVSERDGIPSPIHPFLTNIHYRLTNFPHLKRTSSFLRGRQTEERSLVFTTRLSPAPFPNNSWHVSFPPPSYDADVDVWWCVKDQDVRKRVSFQRTLSSCQDDSWQEREERVLRGREGKKEKKSDCLFHPTIFHTQVPPFTPHNKHNGMNGRLSPSTFS